ncbi:MAG: hypothetical protein JF886_14240 [Candidatus Dormibacteraeota bacterium]|uniref:Uncharacterized protein n=1 Tax=Candidatus Aeolococcus gillhamiae TaxID=3127015 RepID=A0A934K5L6_9BACT|nr:hypothetical protein [Candidatus Dormibacteraeota bacterium]
MPQLGPAVQTRAGAANAAAAVDCVLGGPLVTTPRAYEAALAQILASDRTGTAAQIAQQESAQIDAQTGVVAAAAGGTRTYVGCIPLGYRVESFTSSTASVSVWTEQIVAVEGRYAPASAYITETLQLVWRGGAWKLESSELLDTAWAPAPLEPALAESTTLPAQLLTFTPYGGS